MADDANPFANLFPTLSGAQPPSDLWGPPIQLRMQREATATANAQLGSQKAEQQALGELWGELSTTFPDHGEALKRFVFHPRFISSPLAKDQASMLKLVQEITAPAKPIMQAEGSTVLSPDGRTVVQQPAYKPQVVGPNAALVTREGAVLHDQPGPVKEPKETEADKANVRKGFEILGKVSEEGERAGADLANLTQLRQNLQGKPGGVLGGLKGLAAQWGVNVEGKTDYQIASSLIDRLTPAQRGGLPGSASDRDVAMFKNSLPGFFKSEKGNMALMDTLIGLAEHKAERGALATKVFTGEIPDYQTALKQIRELPNPLERFRATDSGMAIEKMMPEQLQALDTKALTPEQLKRAAKRWDELHRGK